MKLFETLKKYNIMRTGSVAATYKNAKDRPIELQDDMFLGKTANKEKTVKPSVSKEKATTTALSKTTFVTVLVLAFFIIFLSFTSKISWLLIVAWMVLIWYFWAIKRDKLVWKFSLGIGLSLGIVFFVSLFIIVLTQTETAKDSPGNTAKKQSVAKLSSEQCKPYFEKYDNTILKLSSDGLQGTIGVKIDSSNGCKLKAYYNVLFAYELPQNPYKRDIGPSYHYIMLLRDTSQTTRTKYDGYGAIYAVYKNHTQLLDAFAGSRDRSEMYSSGVNATETRYFTWGYQVDTEFSEERYQELRSKTKLEVVDGVNFIEESQGDNGLYTYSINHDRASVDGEIVKTYQLTVEE